VKALVFGDPPDPAEVRPDPADQADEALLSLPFGLHHVPDARPRRDDWVVTRPLLTGICGSDIKFMLGDLHEGDIDNPLAAFSSLPLVPGHEVVAEVVELGPEARRLEIGQRVVLNPWLTCAPRGISPVCPSCVVGDFNLCWSFTTGEIGNGLHIGITTGAPGGWAELLAAHDSMLFAVPDAVSDEQAVLTDPFSVSLHAVLRNPPPEGGRALVYGAGSLGLTCVAALRALRPDVEVAVVARFDAQAAMATAFGASLVVAHEPRDESIEALATWSGGILHPALLGLPMAHPGGVDVVYDTIAKPETLEMGSRLLAQRGTLVIIGVATPGRWESTPVYFKELTVVGSNAFGFEEMAGRRRHAIEHYFDLVTSGRVDLTGMVTHRFGLEEWWGAMQVLAHQDASGALKVAFAPNG
jgi:threonine dehydrogenase-like Zn-dependent dehydrogenase